MSTWQGMADGPLAGLRVVDMSTTLMGPYCSLLLAQLGADVIKVEAPTGDIVRGIGDRHGNGLGHAFMNVNRGKRSVVLDLKTDEGHAALMSLLATADVFCHNLRPAKARRLGLEYEVLAEGNPGLICCSMSGFNRSGPYADFAAYDDVVQGACGTAALQGDPDPSYVRTAHVDKTVGLMATSAIMAALYERGSSGLGQAVDVPMFESMVAMNAMEQMGGLVYDPQDGPAGYGRTSSPYRKPYATKDGFVSVVVYTDRQWLVFFELIGRSDLASDPRFRTIRERTLHIDELYQVLESALPERTTEDWLRAFAECDIPAMAVLTLSELLDDPQVVASGLFEAVDHPDEGKLRQPGLAWQFSRTPPGPTESAARLGAHTHSVLESLTVHQPVRPARRHPG
ncbi:CaiB/BaiF CoA transferase family protein [Streptomyces sp. NPDC055078]